jgi:hypothetical protein
MSHIQKLQQTIKLDEWRPPKELTLPEYLEDLPKNSRDHVIANEKNYADIATRINWLIDRAAGYFASIHQHGEEVDIALAAQDTFYQITGFTTNGSYHASTPDYKENHITIDTSGKYFVFIGLACHSHASNIYDFHIQKNNGATEIEEVTLHFTTATAGRVVNGYAADYISLTKDDTIEVWAKRTNGGAVTKTITIDQINIGVLRVGEPD